MPDGGGGENVENVEGKRKMTHDREKRTSRNDMNHKTSRILKGRGRVGGNKLEEEKAENEDTRWKEVNIRMSKNSREEKEGRREEMIKNDKNFKRKSEKKVDKVTAERKGKTKLDNNLHGNERHEKKIELKTTEMMKE